MDLTMLPSKKTRAEWSCGLLLIAQGNSVIEITPDQAAALSAFILKTSRPAKVADGHGKDLGV